MKATIKLFAAIAVFALATCSQSVSFAASQNTIWNNVGVCDVNAPQNCIAPNSSGAVPTTSSGSGATADQVQGNSAAGTTTATNPMVVGGVANSAIPVGVSDGQKTNLWTSQRGAAVSAIGTTAAGADGSSNNISILAWPSNSNGSVSGQLEIRPYVYDQILGTWQRQRGSTDGTATLNAPTASSTFALTPVVTSAVASSLVLKASAGNFYGLTTVAGASAGFVMLFDATTAPADGAVTPKECLPIAANSSNTISYIPGPPIAYTTGIVAVFSTTGCFSKTASATAFFSGKVK